MVNGWDHLPLNESPQTEYKSRELEILRFVSHPNIVSLRFFSIRKVLLIIKSLSKFSNGMCLPSNFTIRNQILSSIQIHYSISPYESLYFQLARAMLYLHGYGISHRDIKPSNILVDPNTVRLKICDFGSAKN